MTPITIDTVTVDADGVDIVTVSDIPAGGVAILYRVGTEGVQVELERYGPIDDGEFELSFDTPGDYVLKVTGKVIIAEVIEDDVVIGTDVTERFTLEAFINAT